MDPGKQNKKAPDYAILKPHCEECNDMHFPEDCKKRPISYRFYKLHGDKERIAEQMWVDLWSMFSELLYIAPSLNLVKAAKHYTNNSPK